MVLVKDSWEGNLPGKGLSGRAMTKWRAAECKAWFAASTSTIIALSSMLAVPEFDLAADFPCWQAGVLRPAREPEDFGDMLPSAAARARGSGRTRRWSHLSWCERHAPPPCKHSHIQRPQFLRRAGVLLRSCIVCLLDTLDAKVCLGVHELLNSAVSAHAFPACT